MDQLGYVVFYLVIITAGALVGMKLITPVLRRKYGRDDAATAAKSPLVRWISVLQFGAILFIVFLMGLRIGADRRIFDSLDTIGVAALIITIASTGFSVLFVFLLRRGLGFDKRGVRHPKGVSAAECKGLAPRDDGDSGTGQ
jgi:uncharacterized protein YybS (DUF2232 family)